jgi:ribosome-binding ATPase YchF (GTP1/OBG family)
MLEVGVIGKPNVGKSTFFSAATMNVVPIASYPFTTIEPNKGIAHVRARCPHLDFGVPCNPQNSQCVQGIRLVPISLLDVAGLVPGAHEGRGLGNKFMDDLRQADAFIQVVDASGGTDKEGSPCDIGTSDPLEDVRFIEDEIDHWIAGILSRDWVKQARQLKMTKAMKVEGVLAERLGGLGVKEAHVASVLASGSYPEDMERWNQADLFNFSRGIRRAAKRMVVVANKADQAPDALLKKVTDTGAIATSADYELALKRAAKKGLISYLQGSDGFDIPTANSFTEAQKAGLEKIRAFLARFGSTGVQKALEKVVFDEMKMMVVYPVEDEGSWKDKKGNVLPDAHLVPEGCTTREFAYRIHTDLGERFIRGIDARQKLTVGADHVLKNGDVIKIVAKV